MCGIAGIVAPRGQAADREVAERMAAALAHRGPDAQGCWVSADGRVALAHRRLAIIDLDARAHQPLVASDGVTAVVFNGEIYNYAALRRELLLAGCRLRTASDTEVLAEGYRLWGLEPLLERLDGIFSFVLFDGRTGDTHLVRDRYGIKPLYVAWHPQGCAAPQLMFGSELKALVAHPALRARPDWSQVAHYLTFMSVPAPHTILRGVWKVPAGCRVVVQPDGTACLKRYYETAAHCTAHACLARTRLVESIRSTFTEVVTAQMVADVPVGVMLSGGLDSGAILAAASRVRGNVDAYTIAFADDPDNDETPLAVQTARRCGARHHLLRLDPARAIEQVDTVIAAMDEPQADWVCIPLWFLAREVSARGQKVILVGEGADELFFGYEHWRRYLQDIARLAQWARWLSPAARLVAYVLRSSAAHRISMRTRADFLWRAVSAREDLFWGGAILCWPLVLEGLLRPDEVQGPAPRPAWNMDGGYEELEPGLSPAQRVAAWQRAITAAAPEADPPTRMIALEFRQRLPELLLMRVDKMTMAHGVEARVPFLARAMVELALRIPAQEKLAGQDTKALLREAFADLLPQPVLAGRKRGFSAPVARWLRGPFHRRVMHEIERAPLAGALDLAVVRQVARDHQAGAANHAAILWGLFVLARWMTLSGIDCSR